MKKLKLPDTIKYVISDFDGIMTDNTVLIDDKLNISRKINFKDVMGIFYLKKNGIETIFVSGEKNSIIDLLKEKFQLAENHQDIRKKIDILKDIITRYNLTQENYLYIGDDINDRECLEYAKYKITVPNAAESIKNMKKIQITNASGGQGALREVADCLLKQL